MRLACVILSLLLSACAGGSGSSGFDISPGAENQAINDALAAKQCLPGEALTICPANETALDVPVPGATPAPEGVDVGTLVDTTDFARCGGSSAAVCTLPVTINADGLTAGAAYQVAARGFDPLSAWVITAPATIPSTQSPTFVATVAVPSASVSVQVAVLVFIDGVGTAPGELVTLTETGATLAFVTAAIPLPR